MNKSDKSKMERQRRRLRDLIKEYSTLGYDVYAEVKGQPLPETIDGIRPDLILKKGEKMIIIEIVSTEEVKRLGSKLERLARYAEERENVRFDIVLSNPKPRLTKKEKLISKGILLNDIQNRLLQEAKKSYSEEFYRGSLICLTVLLENLIREKAIKKKTIEINDKKTTIELLNILRNNRIISENNLKEIYKFVKIRNKVIHQGYEPKRQTIIKLFEFISFFSKSKGLKKFTADAVLVKEEENPN